MYNNNSYKSHEANIAKMVDETDFDSFFREILGDVKRHTYEDSGNYVYKISRREIEKTALGLNSKIYCI